MKGEKEPNVAVMLGMPKDEGDDSEDSLAETKARAEDAAGAFASAVAGKDAKKIVKAFCVLQTLCGKLTELEESGESDEEPKEEEVVEEVPEETKE